MKLCLPEDGNEQAVGWGFSKAWMRPRCIKNADPQVGHLGLLVNGAWEQEDDGGVCNMSWV